MGTQPTAKERREPGCCWLRWRLKTRAPLHGSSFRSVHHLAWVQVQERPHQTLLHFGIHFGIRSAGQLQNFCGPVRYKARSDAAGHGVACRTTGGPLSRAVKRIVLRRRTARCCCGSSRPPPPGSRLPRLPRSPRTCSRRGVCSLLRLAADGHKQHKVAFPCCLRQMTDSPSHDSLAEVAR